MLNELYQHFASQIEVQGWESSTVVEDDEILSTSWVRQVNNRFDTELAGELTIQETEDDQYSIRFRMEVISGVIEALSPLR